MSQDQPSSILIVDDCELDRRLVEKLLRGHDFDLIEAENGSEALDLARSALPRLVIMDVMMPVMDGLEATRALRNDPLTRHIPIIIVSAKGQEVDLVAGLDAGADEYICKPIRPGEFRIRVRAMIKLSEAQRETERVTASLERRTQVLTTLNRFCEQALADGSLEATCRNIVETAAELLDSKRVSLLIPDASGQALRIAHAVGMSDNDWVNRKVSLDTPLAGQVFSRQQEMIVNHDDDPRPSATDGEYESPYFASLPLMCAPLRSPTGAIGVLNVTERRGNARYRPEDIEVLRQFAQTTAIALNDIQNRKGVTRVPLCSPPAFSPHQ